MTTFEINKNQGQATGYIATVEAVKYQQEGDYFVFYGDDDRTKKVLTVKAEIVHTIDAEDA